jgi:chromosome segregation ATPase
MAVRMATQPNTLDLAQLQGIVKWLEDQQRQDREVIGRLTQEVERLAQLTKEQATQVIDLRGALEEGRAALARLPLVDEAIKHERQQISQLTERFDSHSQQIAHALMLRSADAERDRKQVGELGQVVAQLERDDQALSARVKILIDEERRDRARLESLPTAIEELGERLGAVGHRAEQAEEAIKRADNLGQAHSQELETIRGEQARAAQWRQLSDLRATRQVAEWQQMIDNWRQTVEEQQRPVQYLTAQLAQAREEIRVVANQIDDQARRQDDVGAVLARLDTGLSQAREAVARLEQATDAQRRRFDEQASAQLRLDEALGRAGEHRLELAGTIQSQSRQIDALDSALRALEGSLVRSREELQIGQVELRQQSDGIRAQLQQTAERIEAAAQAFQSRISDFERMSQEHHQRLASELEQQSRELGELAARFRLG